MTPQHPRATATHSPATDGVSISEAIDIGSRLQLFVDDYLIEEMSGVELTLHRPTPMETVLELDQPWENETNGYFTVFKDDDRYRMYYRCSAVVAERTCYAESEDGIVWTRPELGIIEFAGSTKNNMIWTGDVSHNFAAFKDTNPAAAADQQYKALGGQPPQAFASADGVHWREIADGPVLTWGAFDSQNLAFWDAERGHYVAYYRIWSDDDVRAIGTSISDDFINWRDRQAIDLGDAPQEHLYTNAITPYFRAPDVLLSFPKRFQSERKVVESHPHSGVSDSVFMTSRDGLNFERTFMEAFLRPGRELRNWTERSNMVAWGVVPTAKKRDFRVRLPALPAPQFPHGARGAQGRWIRVGERRVRGRRADHSATNILRGYSRTQLRNFRGWQHSSRGAGRCRKTDHGLHSQGR
jgi:hypothetical protein